MYKLVALFKRPADPAAFEHRWAHEFVPLAERMPGIRRIAVSHTQGGPAGPTPFYLTHEFFFDTLDEVRAAMASPEGQAAGRCLMTIAPDDVTLYFAEHLEEERGA